MPRTSAALPCASLVLPPPPAWPGPSCASHGQVRQTKGDPAFALPFTRGAAVEGWWAADCTQPSSKFIFNQVVLNKTIPGLYVGTEAVMQVAHYCISFVLQLKVTFLLHCVITSRSRQPARPFPTPWAWQHFQPAAEARAMPLPGCPARDEMLSQPHRHGPASAASAPPGSSAGDATTGTGRRARWPSVGHGQPRPLARAGHSHARGRAGVLA